MNPGTDAAGVPRPGGLRAEAAAFEADTGCLSRLRGWIGQVLGGSPYEGCLDSVVCAAGELAGNAVLHTESRRSGFAASLMWNSELLQVAVQDQGGRGHPRLVPPEHAAESGRGLVLVDSVTDGWSWTPNAFGTVVWFQMQAKRCSHDE